MGGRRRRIRRKRRRRRGRGGGNIRVKGDREKGRLFCTLYISIILYNY